MCCKQKKKKTNEKIFLFYYLNNIKTTPIDDCTLIALIYCSCTVVGGAVNVDIDVDVAVWND